MVGDLQFLHQNKLNKKDLTFNESYAINKEFVETKMKLDWTWGRYPSPPPRMLAQYNAFIASQETVLETVR